MVVFTAKINVTGETFVGSARENVEEHWAQLIALAEDGGSGELLDSIRAHGANNIAVETWDYAESPSESRELIREACDQLNGKVIKTGRVKLARVSTDTPKEKDDLSIQAQQILNQNQLKAEAEKKAQQQAKAKPSQTEHGQVISIDIEAYQAQQKANMPEKTEPEPVSLRHTASTEIADDMKSVMVRIEMQRKMNQAKNSPTRKRATSAKKVSSITTSKTTAQKEVVKKLKLPDGRVSSSVKEKRIKEAIAQEKMEREAIRASQVAAEANDMAAMLAKLDERTREKGKLMRRR